MFKVLVYKYFLRTEMMTQNCSSLKELLQKPKCFFCSAVIHQSEELRKIHYLWKHPLESIYRMKLLDREENFNQEPPISAQSETLIEQILSPDESEQNANDTETDESVSTPLSSGIPAFSSEEIMGLVQTEDGARKITELLETGTACERKKIADILVPETLKLAKDQCGFRPVCTLIANWADSVPKIQQELLSVDLTDLSQTLPGSEILCALLKHVKNQRNKLAIAGRFRGSVNLLSSHAYGSKVILAALEDQDTAEICEFLPAELSEGDMKQLATHEYASRIVSTVVRNCFGDPKKKIKDLLLILSKNICKNQYGAQVLRALLRNGSDLDKLEIFTQIKGDLMNILLNQHSSQIVLDILKYTRVPKDRVAMGQQVLSLLSKSDRCCMRLCADKNAKSVLLLLMADPNLKADLLGIIGTKKNILLGAAPAMFPD